MRVGVLFASWVLFVLGTAGAALAHPGHGTTDPHSFVHYVAEPVHVAPLWLAGIAASAAAISLLARRRSA